MKRIPLTIRAGVMVVVLAVATLGVLVMAGAVFGTSHADGTPAPGSPPSPTSVQLAQLRTLVLQVSASYGESSPSDGTVVSSTRAAANELVSGAKIEDNSGSYVIQVLGHFQAVRHPAFAPAPAGTVLTIVVDAATMTPSDTTISNSAPDLGELGPTQSLG